MVPIPTQRERQFMQRLRGRSWVKAFELPDAQKILKHLLEKRWIESQGAGKDLSFQDHRSAIGCEESTDPAAPEMSRPGRAPVNDNFQ
jgi:hypothetical protein